MIAAQYGLDSLASDSVTSSKPFDQVVAALDVAIGHPDMLNLRDQLAKRVPLPS